MRAPVIEAQQGFGGGLNQSAQHIELAPNELRLAGNVRLTTYGAARRRGGSQRVSAAAIAGGVAPVTGGVAWQQPSTTTELVTCNGRLYSGTYAIPMTWTDVGAFPGTFPSFAAFRDATGECMYMCMKTLPGLYKYKAGVISAVSGAALVSRICVQNQRLFGITGADQTLWYSALNNGDTLGVEANGGGSQIVRTYSNQELRGLLALGSSLLMFHRSGISKFTGYGQGDITISSGTRGVSADVGTIAPDSIIAVENVAYFLCDRGIYRVTEENVAPISAKIENTIQSLGPLAWERVKTVHNRPFREVWFYFPDNEGIYVYNYRMDAWTGAQGGAGSQIYALWESVTSSGGPVILSGGLDGFVRRWDGTGNYKDDVLSDGTGGSAYPITLQCHRMYHGSPENEKAYRFIKVEGDNASSANVTVTWSTETGSNSATLAAVSGEQSQRVQASRRGKYVDVTLSDTGATASVYSRLVVEGFDYGSRY